MELWVKYMVQQLGEANPEILFLKGLTQHLSNVLVVQRAPSPVRESLEVTGKTPYFNLFLKHLCSSSLLEKLVY